jgi:hypothetical protein
MKTGCFFSLALLTGFILLYRPWIAHTVDSPYDWAGAAALGIGAWLSFGALLHAWGLGKTIRALRAAVEGLRPVNRRLTAVAGELHPYGEPIVAPLSRRTCVIYEYEIKRIVPGGDGQDHEPLDFTGIGMAPCEVRPEEGDPIALWGYPDYQKLTQERCGPRERAREFVEGTTWERVNLVTGLAKLIGVWTSVTETIRRDLQLIKPDDCPWLPVPDETPEQMEERRRNDSYQPRLLERRLEVGQRVTVLGRYHEESQALVAAKGTNFRPLELRKQPPAAWLKEARVSRRSYLIGGVIAAVMIHLVAVLALTVYRNSEATQRDWRKGFETAVAEVDVLAMEKYLARGIDINQPLDAEENTALLLTDNPFVIRWLHARGARLDHQNEDGYSALMLRTAAGHRLCVETLIELGADLNLRRTEDGATALMIADNQDRAEFATLLREAGAQDEVISAERGEPLTTDHPAVQVCVAYLAAVHAEDRAALKAAVVERMHGYYDDFDWGEWQGVRPIEPVLDEGYVQGDRATITLSGLTPKEFTTQWTYQLELVDGRWLIARERWRVGP